MVFTQWTMDWRLKNCADTLLLSSQLLARAEYVDSSELSCHDQQQEMAQGGFRRTPFVHMVCTFTVISFPTSLVDLQ